MQIAWWGRYTWKMTAWVLLGAFFLLLPARAVSARLPAGRLVVLGVRNEVNRPEWNDQLIGYGLAQLLLQELYNTGLYVPIETNPGIINEINRLIKAYWRAEAREYTAAETDALANKFAGDVTAYATVKKVASERSRTSVGPFSSAQTVVIIAVEVTLKKVGEEEIRVNGEGRSATKAKTIMFTIRDDKLQLDETAVGRAAEKAIKNAVEELRQ